MADTPPIGSPPVGGPPRVLSPATHARYESAVGYVESLIRTRQPRPGTSRFPGAAWRAWGLLEPGETITGRSGLTLGEGDVQRYHQDEADLVDANDRIHVYNLGGEIKADSGGDGLLFPLSWNGGHWVLESPPDPPCLIGQVTAQITGRSGTTSAPNWGVGQVKPYVPPGASGGAWSLSSDPVYAYNTMLEAIDVGLIVHCKRVGGLWFVDVVECGS